MRLFCSSVDILKLNKTKELRNPLRFILVVCLYIGWAVFLLGRKEVI